jgi:hypothetical protein
VRELLPQDLKIEIERLGANEAAEVARYLSFVDGEAHMRRLARADGAKVAQGVAGCSVKVPRRAKLALASVVDLLAIHDRAHLDHCPRAPAQQEG